MRRCRTNQVILGEGLLSTIGACFCMSTGIRAKKNYLFLR